MKTIKYLSFSNYLSLIFLTLLSLFSGCKEEEKDVYFSYTNVPLTTHNPVLVEGELLHIGIGIDGINYRAESDDENIATAEVIDNEILLTGGNVGTTIVRLVDDGYNRALIMVEVRQLHELTLESLPGGASVLRLDNDGSVVHELKILTGNGGYILTNPVPEQVSAEIVEDPDVENGYKLVLSGKANIDHATITVTDIRNKTASVDVRVTNPIRPVSFDVQGPLNGEYKYEDGNEFVPEQISFNITSGNGGYIVQSSNESVATVTVSGEVVTATVVGDGGTTITVSDQEGESRTIDLWVPLNTDDATPRIYWDGYRADINTPGVSIGGNYATKKDIYWYQQDGEIQNTYYVYFNGGWVDNLDCVGVSNRNPKLETTLNGITTTYDDKSSTIQFTEFLLVKRIGVNASSNPHIYFISFTTADGKKGFIVHDWNQ